MTARDAYKAAHRRQRRYGRGSSIWVVSGWPRVTEAIRQTFDQRPPRQPTHIERNGGQPWRADPEARTDNQSR